jgi:ACS family hexuronate transporter-like MFS transporter
MPTPLSDSRPSGAAPSPPPSSFRLPHLRWLICGVLFFGAVINYVDRGTISILSHHVQKIFSMSESDYGWIIFSFQFSYAIMLLGVGRIIDRLGTRMGFALAMIWWSFAAMGQALARGVGSFALACGFLGMGEAGSFPGSIKAVAEWFPKRERALATGIFNSGTAVGAVISYPLVGWLFLRWGWQMAFVGTGALGLVCVAIWLLLYRLPRKHRWITPGELHHIETEPGDDQEVLGAPLAWGKIFGYRQAWTFIMAKFMTDPVWWFYIFWLPKYLIEARHFSVEHLRLFGFIPFLAAVPGGVTGGWLSGYLLRRGRSLNFARKTALLACAVCMPVGILAVFAGSPWMALAFISVGTAGHQGWMSTVFTLPSDTFPKKDVGSVMGIGGAAGAFGGAILAWVAGHILQHHSYVPLFIIAGVMHPLTMGVIQLLTPKIEKIPQTAAPAV